MEVSRVRNSDVRILSPNVLGMRTNLGDLTHTTLRNGAGTVVCCETFLDDSIPPTYGQIKGYTKWYHRQGLPGWGYCCASQDRPTRTTLYIDLPDALEIMFLKLFVGSDDTILLPACCRPQWQGSAPLEYLKDTLDTLVMQQASANMLIAGDLNHHLVPRSFDELLLIHDLCNHVLVGFQTHESGARLDFVLFDIPSPLSRCESLSYIGS